MKRSLPFPAVTPVLGGELILKEGGGLLFRRGGQVYMEKRALSGFRVHRDQAAMVLDDGVADAQAEPVPFSLPICFLVK